MSADQVSFCATPTERALARKLARRARSIEVKPAEPGFRPRSVGDWEMDLIATHANGNPLDFEKLDGGDCPGLDWMITRDLASGDNRSDSTKRCQSSPGQSPWTGLTTSISRTTRSASAGTLTAIPASWAASFALALRGAA